MKENTNKAIAYNTLVLYARLAITSILTLFTTRYALKALGIIDFGLFSVLGSITTFIGIFNTIMLSTSNRFIAVAIGKGNLDEANKQFNVNLVIHLFIAAVTIIVAYPLGDWYIDNFVNFEGNITTAKTVFNISVLGSVIAFIGVPYNGLLMAKEKFIVFCSIDVISHILKLIVSILLIYCFNNKLIVYSIALAFLSAYPTLIYAVYCKRKYTNIVKWRVVKEKGRYKEIFTFSGWVAYGALATVAKSQGAALIVNAFFNTIMNTALGIANSINALVTMFAQNVANPIAPQITKAYASNNHWRCNQLLIMSTKLSFMVMFVIAVPFLIETEWILKIWLGEVPPFAAKFTILLIIDALITSLNSGISNIIFASGRIALYQVVVNTLRLLAIIAAYFALKIFKEPYSLLYAYILFSVINFFVVQWVLNKTLKFDNRILVKESYIPSFKIVLLFLPVLFIKVPMANIVHIIIALIYVISIIYLIGLNKDEKEYCLKMINTLKNNYFNCQHP